MRRATRGPVRLVGLAFWKRALRGRICFLVSVLRSLGIPARQSMCRAGALRRQPCLGGGVDRWKVAFPGSLRTGSDPGSGLVYSCGFQGSSDLCEDVFGVWPGGRGRRKGRLRLLPECDGPLCTRAEAADPVEGRTKNRQKELRSAFFS